MKRFPAEGTRIESPVSSTPTLEFRIHFKKHCFYELTLGDTNRQAPNARLELLAASMAN